MPRDIYPNYHSLTHKFVQVKNSYFNIDHISHIEDGSNIAEGPYGLSFHLQNGTTQPVSFEHKDEYDAAMLPLRDMFLIVRNPSIPFDDQHAPVFNTIGQIQATPSAPAFHKIIHPDVIPVNPVVDEQQGG